MENSAFYSQNLLVKEMETALPTVLSRTETQTPAGKSKSQAWEAEVTPARMGQGCGGFSAAPDRNMR